jgi:hypothetical protein
MRVRTNLVRLLAAGCAALATAASAQTTVPAPPKPLQPPQICFAASGCARTQPVAVCFAATGASKDPCARTKPTYAYASTPAIATASATVTTVQFAPPARIATTTKP